MSSPISSGRRHAAGFTPGPAGRIAGRYRDQYAGAGPLQRAGLLILRVVAAGGLAVDAYVHANLAANYDGIGGTITEGALFRIEAGVASAAALLILAVGGRLGYTVAATAAGSALAAILVYRYINVGSIGPLPNMYEPAWFTEKSVAAFAEAAATAAAGLLALDSGLRGIRRKPARRH
jgi:hypothetical protein